MKKYPILFFLTILFFSCGKEEFSTNQPMDEVVTTRNSDDAGCSITFLGYDENGCCMYQLNYVSTSDEASGGKYKYYVTVDGKVIKGTTFTICDSGWVRLIKESKQVSILVCSSFLECEQSCDIDVTFEETDASGDCCWTLTTTGIDNHTLSINGDEQTLTSDIAMCICASEGETIEIVILDENGAICYEHSVTCYTCDECDQNYLSVKMSAAPPENGLECCYVTLKKEGPLYICDSGGGSNWVYPENGVTITGLGGSPATVSMKICREDWAETVLTGWWDTTDNGVPICPRMEIDFDLEDCN